MNGDIDLIRLFLAKNVKDNLILLLYNIFSYIMLYLILFIENIRQVVLERILVIIILVYYGAREITRKRLKSQFNKSPLVSLFSGKEMFCLLPRI